MINVKEAKEILFQNIPQSIPEAHSIEDSAGFVLAEDLFSPMDIPQFDNSAMDGFAFSFEDFEKGDILKVNHIIQAGSQNQPDILPGEAARIFTGAPMPKGLDTVVMQEMASMVDEVLEIIPDAVIRKGDHIRKKASQTARGEQVAMKGTLINPALIGFLAGLGIEKVMVFKAPQVLIVTSGKELVPPGKELKTGQIYESSSYALKAALKQLQINPKKFPIVDDKRDHMLKAIQKGLEESDILLITGGISVGDYDFVHSILEELGIQKLFYKIKQKPGKPLFAGKKGNKLVFGLPGNPASTLSCFYQYVRPAIQLMMGMEQYIQPSELFPITDSFQKKAGLTNFMKGSADQGFVRILTDQESYKMNSFAVSNCLVELDEEKSEFKKGDLVKVHFL